MKAFPMDGGAAITSDITNNYVYCGLAETPDQVPDSVSGKIALIARGGTVNTPAASPVSAGTGLFSNKAAFAVAKGAVAVVFFNNVDGDLTSTTVRKSTVPVVGISKANGEYLRDAVGSNTFGAVSVNLRSHSAAAAPCTAARRWRASASHCASVLSAAFHASSA